MTRCKGCGVKLQTNDPSQPGYTPKSGSLYCQRCYRLRHYDDLTSYPSGEFAEEEILARIASLDGVVLWVVDLFDFEAGMIEGLNKKLPDKEIIMAATKRDLLPAAFTTAKATAFCKERLNTLGIRVNSICIISALAKQGLKALLNELGGVSKQKAIVLAGRANAGKSTLMNALTAGEALTVSRYPGTTLCFNGIEHNGRRFIDTPGLMPEGSMLMQADEDDLKYIIPSRRIKPRIYQLRGDQSFAVGGLSRIDLYGCQEVTAVFYISDALPLHRGKIINADAFWLDHAGKDLRPFSKEQDMIPHTITKSDDKIDAVIDGLGFVCISGFLSKITVYAPKGVKITFRKAMI